MKGYKWGIAIMVVAFAGMVVAYAILLVKYINVKKLRESEIDIESANT